MLGDMLQREEEFLDGFTAEKFMVAVEFNEKKKKRKKNILPKILSFIFATNVSSSSL